MPVYLLMFSFYSMNAFEPLIWTSILYFIIRLVHEENARYWLVLGLLMGVRLETKHTMAVYGAASYRWYASGRHATSPLESMVSLASAIGFDQDIHCSFCRTRRSHKTICKRPRSRDSYMRGVHPSPAEDPDLRCPRTQVLDNERMGEIQNL
jgi:hypothetical protein